MAQVNTHNSIRSGTYEITSPKLLQKEELTKTGGWALNLKNLSH